MAVAALELIARRQFVRGNHVVVHRSGGEYFPAIFDALAAARDSIRIEMYAIWRGEICDRLCQILGNRAAAGLSVRVIADAYGSRAWPRRDIQRLRRTGAQIILYNRPSLKRLNKLALRTHRKAIIVDDMVAFVGGFNFVDVFNDCGAEAAWLDFVVELNGPIVTAAAATFDRSWRQFGALNVLRPQFSPTARGTGESEVLLIDSFVQCGLPTVRAMHESAIGSARDRILIRNPFFLPDKRMLECIAGTTKRGVNVRVIVPGRRMDHRILLDANRGRYASLLKLGVRMFEYEPAMMHAKTIVVDGELTLIGSANFDYRSLANNDELTVAIRDPSVGAIMETQFVSDLGMSSEVGYAQRSFRQVVAGALTRFL